MSIEKNIKDEIRKEFQLDRIVLFSDAVFAIAIPEKYKLFSKDFYG